MLRGIAGRPRGTVTFLFTDVEGSTELLKQLRDRYGGVLADHQRLLRRAFAAHGGEEVDTQGDAFFYVFSRARDAVAAAAEGQRALAANAWPEGTDVRVRMGIHTGEPDLSDEGRYHGMGVHRTARITAAGHGGQVLASQATASVLADDELDGISLRDLGEHSLKDLDRPERIYQLEIDGLERAFPPLKTDAPATAADELAAPPAPIYRRPLVIGAAAGVLAAAVAIPVFALGGGSGGESLPGLIGNSVGIVDAGSGKIVGDVLDVPTPAHAAAGEGAIWVTSPDAQIVSRIDLQSRDVRQTIRVGSAPTGVAVGDGDVWVANTLEGTVSRIDAETNQVVGEPIRVGNSPTALASGDGSIWVANLDDQTLSRIDARTGDVVKTLHVGAAARGVAVGDGAVWVSDGARNRVVRVDARSGDVTQVINVGSGPTAVAFGAGSVWVANSLDGTVSQIDPRANVVRATIPVGSGPNGLAVSGNDVWVTNETGASLARLDAARGSVAARMSLGSRPGGVVLVGGSLFVTAQSSAAHRGGTLTVQGGAPDVLGSLDPGNAFIPVSWEILTITNDGLLAFKRVGGGDGTQLVPDLATSVPAPTGDGKTYTFQLRAGIRFSNGSLVRPADLRHSIEREFAIRGSPGAGFFAGLEGASACAKAPQRCDLSRGIVTDAARGTVTFHLTKPDPEFLYKLATPSGAVVPADAPRAESRTPLAATGPYMIASYDPKRGLRLVRNPHFHVWSAAARPDGYADELRWVFEADKNAAISAVERGRADVLLATDVSSRVAELTTQYAAQVHATPEPATYFLVMNTHRPPFDDVRVRRAVNYALDRNELIRLGGGPLTAQPTCQILPPNFPGYRPYCPYTLHPTSGGTWSAPDLAKAEALVRASGTPGAKVSLLACSCSNSRAIRYERAVLERLGYRVTLRVLGYRGYHRQVFSHPQIAEYGWIPDYPAASNFFAALACGRIENQGGFCDPALDREVRRAAALQQNDPRAAGELWAKLDRQATDQAPWVSTETPRHLGLVSKRVGNYQHHAVYGILLDQLWVR